MFAESADSGKRTGIRTVWAAGAAVAVGMCLGGCGGNNDSAVASTTSSATSPTSNSSSAADASSSQSSTALTLRAGWSKAAQSGMTAVFGTLHNSGSTPITITGGSSDVAGLVETHTMKMDNGQMVMTRKADGFTVPAGGDYELTPGSDHIMLLELKKPLENGNDVTLTLTDKSGGRYRFTVPVREFSGADESYKPTMSHS